MVDLFKMLSDETRLRCLVLLSEQNELCVCELMYALDLPQSKVSRHLANLKTNELVTQRREEQWVLYSINPDLDVFNKEIINKCVQNAKHISIFKKDLERLLSTDTRS